VKAPAVLLDHLYRIQLLNHSTVLPSAFRVSFSSAMAFRYNKGFVI
jgi:hypothetical protein